MSSVNNVRLGEKLTTQFVQLYREERLLWDTEHELYKKRTERLLAYRRIVDGMQIDGFGVPEVANKIKNIRSTYLQEVKKIKESSAAAQQQQLDENGKETQPYVPKVLWFPIMDAMLGFSNHEPSYHHHHQLSPSDTQIIALDYVDECSDHSYTTLVEDFGGQTAKSSSSSAVKKRPPPPPSSTSIDLPAAKRPHYDNQSTQDEIQLFSKYVAASLATLPPELAVHAQKDLNDVIFKYKIMKIGQH